jgi:hypothetical protein
MYQIKIESLEKTKAFGVHRSSTKENTAERKSCHRNID